MNQKVSRLSLALAVATLLPSPHATAQLSTDQKLQARKNERLPAPTIPYDEFLGIYESQPLDRVDGGSDSAGKFALECSENYCLLKSGSYTERYSHHGTVMQGLFERTRLSIARQFRGARLRGCINLGSDNAPDGPFACRAAGMPGDTDPVILVPPGPPGVKFLSIRDNAESIETF